MGSGLGDRLAGIRPNASYADGESMLTYTGMALINSINLSHRKGPANFLKAWRTQQKLKVSVQSIDEESLLGLWHVLGAIGTALSMFFSAWGQKDEPFVRFLIRTKRLYRGKSKRELLWGR